METKRLQALLNHLWSKNFGFISGDDGKHYFFQGCRLNPGITVDDGDKVFFNIEQSEFGPRAINVGKQ